METSPTRPTHAAHATEEPAQVRIERHYPVAPEKVWRAWTDPQVMSQWFGAGMNGPGATVEIDLQVGGSFRIAFPGPNGESHEARGVYQEVMAPERLVFSWFWKSTPERVSRISIDLKRVAAGCDLSFVHDRFFDDQARINHERGWQPFFEKLGEFLNHIEQEA